MRVLLLAPHPFFQQRGTPIAERMMIEVLLARGHEVEVLTYHEGDDPGLPGCRVRRIPAPPFVRGIRPGFSWKKLVCDAVMLGHALSLVARRRYDLVHAVEESAFMALAAKALFGVPYVYDMDSGLAQQMVDKLPPLARVRPLLAWCERRAVRGSVAVLAVCRSLEEQALAEHPERRVARIEDITLLAPANGHGTERLGDLVGDGGPIVLYVGNLEPYQGIDLLLEGFARALPRVPSARLVVIGGEAADRARYAARSRELGLDGEVVFAGPRPVERLGDYLAQATVLVSPRTAGHNTPMKVYSYLDSGRPLLATRLPTHTQVLDDEVACLVEPRAEAFADGLVCLLADEVLRERLAGNAKRFAQREFTPEAFETKLLNFYDSVAERIGDAREQDGRRRIHHQGGR